MLFPPSMLAKGNQRELLRIQGSEDFEAWHFWTLTIWAARTGPKLIDEAERVKGFETTAIRN